MHFICVYQQYMTYSLKHYLYNICNGFSDFFYIFLFLSKVSECYKSFCPISDQITTFSLFISLFLYLRGEFILISFRWTHFKNCWVNFYPVWARMSPAKLVVKIMLELVTKALFTCC